MGRNFIGITSASVVATLLGIISGELNAETAKSGK